MQQFILQMFLDVQCIQNKLSVALFHCKSIQHVGKIFSPCRFSIASTIIQPLKVTPSFHPLSWLSFQKWASRRYFLHRWCELFLANFLIKWVEFSKIHEVRVSRRILTCPVVPFILFIDSASLFNHFLFYILSAIS